MPVRKISEMGGSGEHTTFGVSLDRGDLDRDGLLEQLNQGDDVHVSIDRREPGRYELVILNVDDRDQGIEPTAD